MATSFQSPTQSQQQVTKALLAFYQKPVAQVSTELFFTIGAVVFFAIFAIRPTILTMTDLIKEIEDKEKTSEALSKKVAALSSVQIEYFALQNQFALLDEIIPPEPDTQHVLKIIEKLATENQVVLNSLSLKEVPIKKAHSTLEFRQKQPTDSEIIITAVGSYPTTRAFLKQLLLTRPMITLESLTLAKALKTNNASQTAPIDELTATLRLKAHYYGKSTESTKPTPQPSSDPSL